MDYITVAEARRTPGLRLVLSKGVPAPWGESAKSIFHVKGIAFTPVGQDLGQPNLELVAWTGIRQAPIAIYNDEPPLHRWLDILMLAERLQPTPSLLPHDFAQRALVVGLGNEICGEWGFGWARRLMFMTDHPAAKTNDAPTDPLAKEYRVSKDAVAAARPRLENILTSLARRVTAQRAAGSPYLVGDTLTAADIWWACFAGYIDPLPPELNPVSGANRGVAAASTPWLDAVKDPVLFQHRDEIYRRHLKLPLDF